MERLDEVPPSQPNTKGRGADNLGPIDIKRLPRKGKEHLLDILHQCELLVAWPWQWLQNLVMLLRMPALGNDRAVGLVVWIVRL